MVARARGAAHRPSPRRKSVRRRRLDNPTNDPFGTTSCNCSLLWHHRPVQPRGGCAAEILRPNGRAPRRLTRPRPVVKPTPRITPWLCPKYSRNRALKSRRSALSAGNSSSPASAGRPFFRKCAILHILQWRGASPYIGGPAVAHPEPGRDSRRGGGRREPRDRRRFQQMSAPVGRPAKWRSASSGAAGRVYAMRRRGSQTTDPTVTIRQRTPFLF